MVVQTFDDLIRHLILNKEPGGTITLTVLRGGEQVDLLLTLAGLNGEDGRACGAGDMHMVSRTGSRGGRSMILISLCYTFNGNC